MRNRRERWVLWGALGGVAALAVAAVTGRFSRRPGGLLVLREWLDEPLLFGTLILVLLFVALVFSTGQVHLIDLAESGEPRSSVSPA
ncbi:hypothetical protein [Kitasatospora sp. NPDC088351]|uniref:hypothetical protein n=1 Tax=Kitasatospora sp. NPDC088351 TaxID=3155180 RepID=UPI00344204C8